TFSLLLNNHFVSMPSLGDTAVFTAVAKDKYGRTQPNRRITWTSLAPDTATADSLGRIVAIRNGDAKIVVSAQTGRPDTLRVHVFQIPASVQINGPANDTVFFNSLRDTVPMT